jgi:hypothetical protein
MHMDGIVPLDGVDALQSTWASCSMGEEIADEQIHDVGDEVLQAALARTVRTRFKNKAPVLASAARAA